MNRRKFVFLASGGVILASAKPRTLLAFPSSEAQAPTFERILASPAARAINTLPIGDAIVSIGRQFLGVPYVGGTLDKDASERCVIEFNALDCVTFFEISLDLTRILRKGKSTYAALIDEVTYTRYRGGKLTDYTSRLHYTSDWIYDNAQKKVITDVTCTLGGVPFNKKIDFMTTHAASYPQLREHPEFVKVIGKFETAISNRADYYIPKDAIAGVEPHLQNGDILAFTSSVPGLDCAHTGIAFIDRGKARLLQASSVGGKVMISDKTIAEYIVGVSHDTGMMVARPIDVSS